MTPSISPYHGAPPLFLAQQPTVESTPLVPLPSESILPEPEPTLLTFAELIQTLANQNGSIRTSTHQMRELGLLILMHIQACSDRYMNEQLNPRARTTFIRELLTSVDYVSSLDLTTKAGQSLATTLRELVDSSETSSLLTQAVVRAATYPDAYGDRGVVLLLQELKRPCYHKLVPVLQSWFRAGKLYLGGGWRSCLATVILAQTEVLDKSDEFPVTSFLDLDFRLQSRKKPPTAVDWAAVVQAAAPSSQASNAIDCATRALRGGLDWSREKIQSRALDDQVRKKAHQLGIAYAQAYYHLLVKSNGIILINPEQQYAALVDLRDEIMSWQGFSRRADAAVVRPFLLQYELYTTTIQAIQSAPKSQLKMLTDWLIRKAQWSAFEHIGHQVLTIRTLQARVETKEPFDQTVKFLFKLHKGGHKAYLNFLQSEGLFVSCKHLVTQLHQLNSVRRNAATLALVQKTILSGLDEHPSSACSLLFDHDFFNTFDPREQCDLLDTLTPYLPAERLLWAWTHRTRYALPTNPKPWGQAFFNHQLAASESLIKVLSSCEPVLAWDLYCANEKVRWKNAANLCKSACLQAPSLDRINQLATFGPLDHKSKLAKRLQKEICNNADLGATKKLDLLQRLKLHSIPTDILLELAIQTGTATPLLEFFQVEEALVLRSADKLICALISRPAGRLPELISAHPKLLCFLVAHLPVEPKDSAARILSALDTEHQMAAARAFLKTDDGSPRRVDAVIHVACTFNLPLPTQHPKAVIEGMKRANLLTSWEEFMRYRTPAALLEANLAFHRAISPALEKSLLTGNQDAIRFALKYPESAPMISLLNAVARSPNVSPQRCRKLSLSLPMCQHLRRLLAQHPSNPALYAIGQTNGLSGDLWLRFLKAPTHQLLTHAAKVRSAILPPSQGSKIAEKAVSLLKSSKSTNVDLLRLSKSSLAPHLKNNRAWLDLYRSAVVTCMTKGHTKSAKNLLDNQPLALLDGTLDNEKLAFFIINEDWSSFEQLFAKADANLNTKRWLKLGLAQHLSLQARITRLTTLFGLYTNAPDHQKKLAAELFSHLSLNKVWMKKQTLRSAAKEMVVVAINLLDTHRSLCKDPMIDQVRHNLLDYAQRLLWPNDELKRQCLPAAVRLLTHETDWNLHIWAHTQILESEKALSVRAMGALLCDFYKGVLHYVLSIGDDLNSISVYLQRFTQEEEAFRRKMSEKIPEPLQYKFGYPIALTEGLVWSQVKRENRGHSKRVSQAALFLTKGSVFSSLSTTDKKMIAHWCQFLLSILATGGGHVDETDSEAVISLLENLPEHIDIKESFDHFINQHTKNRCSAAQAQTWKLATKLPPHIQSLVPDFLPRLRKLLLETVWEYPRAAWGNNIEEMLLAHVGWGQQKDALEAIANWAMRSQNDPERLDDLLQATACPTMSNEQQQSLFRTCLSLLGRDEVTCGRILALGLEVGAPCPDRYAKSLATAEQVLEQTRTSTPPSTALVSAIVLETMEIRLRTNLALPVDGSQKREQLLAKARWIAQIFQNSQTSEIVRLRDRLRSLCGIVELELGKDTPKCSQHVDTAYIDFACVLKHPFAYELQQKLLHSLLDLPRHELAARRTRISFLIKAARKHALYPGGSQDLKQQASWLLTHVMRRLNVQASEELLAAVYEGLFAQLPRDTVSIPFSEWIPLITPLSEIG